jgi:hypothetical protein
MDDDCALHFLLRSARAVPRYRSSFDSPVSAHHAAPVKHIDVKYGAFVRRADHPDGKPP